MQRAGKPLDGQAPQPSVDSYTHGSAYGGFVTVIVGLVGALGAIVTGLTDWSDTYGAGRHIGFNHALFNATATILYLVSFVLRLLAGPGDSIAAIFTAFGLDLNTPAT